VQPSSYHTLAYTPTPAPSCQPGATGADNATYDYEIIAGGGLSTSNGAAALRYSFTPPPLALAVTPNYDVWVGSVGSLNVVRGGSVFWETAQRSGGSDGAGSSPGSGSGGGGPPQGAVVDRITGVAVTPAGDVCMYDDGQAAFHVIHAATGNITTTYISTYYVAGNMSGMTYAEVWGEPSLLIADSQRHVVFKIGDSTAYDLVGLNGYAGHDDSGPYSATLLSAPMDVAWYATASTIYVADSGNRGVRRVNLAGSYGSWQSGPVPGMPNCSYSSVAVDGMGALWVACPTSPTLLRVVGDGTSAPSVVVVAPRSGVRFDGISPYIVVVHPTNNATFDVMGHRVVRAGAPDMVHTLPVLPPGTPSVITAFVAARAACLPSTATPTPSTSATASASSSASSTGTASASSTATPTGTASATATATASTTPTATAAVTLALTKTPTGTATLAPTATPAGGGNASDSGGPDNSIDDGGAGDTRAGDEDQYPAWVVALVGVTLVVGGFGVVLGGAVLVQRCLPAAAGAGSRNRQTPAPPAGKGSGRFSMPFVNPLVTAAAPFRGGGGGGGGGGRPPPVSPAAAAASSRGRGYVRAALPPVHAPGTGTALST